MHTNFKTDRKSADRLFKRMISNFAWPIDPRRNLEKESIKWEKEFQKDLRSTDPYKINSPLFMLKLTYSITDIAGPAMSAVFNENSSGWESFYRWYDASWWYYHANPYKLNGLSQLETDYPLLIPIATLLGHHRRADIIGEFLYSGGKTNRGTVFSFPDGDYLPVTRLIAQLWAIHKGRSLDAFQGHRELPDFYQHLVTLASEPGTPESNAEAAYLACVYHVHDHLSESGFSSYGNFFLGGCPLELLYLNYIRKEKGLPVVTADHPLMTSPLGAFPAFAFNPSIRDERMLRVLEHLITHKRITKEDIVFFDEVNQ